jgi:biotin carboxyl carrier protein
MSKYTIITQEEKFEITEEAISSLNLSKSDKGEYHLLTPTKSVLIEEIQQSSNPKLISVKINGNRYQFRIKDEKDLLVDELGMDSISTKKLSNVSSPMPGLILDILVKAGDSFSKGDPLYILEAMKMENMIKAEGEGIVKEVIGEVNKTVEKNQIILKLED